MLEPLLDLIRLALNARDHGEIERSMRQAHRRIVVFAIQYWFEIGTVNESESEGPKTADFGLS